jgi:hypothetical protein
LVTAFYNFGQGRSKTSTTTIEKNNEVIGLVSLVNVDSWRRAINTFGFGIRIVNDFLERLLFGKYGC